MEAWDFVGRADMSEEDFFVCTWWYGGETLSPGICMIFEPAEDMILAVSPLSQMETGPTLTGLATLRDFSAIDDLLPPFSPFAPFLDHFGQFCTLRKNCFHDVSFPLASGQGEHSIVR